MGLFTRKKKPAQDASKPSASPSPDPRERQDNSELTRHDREALLAAIEALEQIAATKPDRLKQAFGELDVDGSGSLSTKEFIAVPGKLGLSLTLAEQAHLMSVLDGDHDGQISLQELVGGLQRTRRALLGLAEDEELPNPKPLPPRPPPPMSDAGPGDSDTPAGLPPPGAVKSAAAAWQHGGVGMVSIALGKLKSKLTLSRQEREKLLSVIEAIERYAVRSPDKLRATFQEVDLDGSGSLSPAEFMGVLKKLSLPLDAKERGQVCASHFVASGQTST